MKKERKKVSEQLTQMRKKKESKDRWIAKIVKMS